MKYILITLLAIVLSGFVFCPKMALSEERDSDAAMKKKLIAYMPNDIQRLVREIRTLDYKDSDAKLTQYGYDFYEDRDEDSQTGVRLRGGVSRISTNAAPSLELVITW